MGIKEMFDGDMWGFLNGEWGIVDGENFWLWLYE